MTRGDAHRASPPGWAAAALAAALAPGPLSRRGAGWALALVRAAGAVTFVSFGVGKFVNHAAETASFSGYGLPAPDAFTSAIGALELAGGLLLLAGFATRIVAALLAGDMLGAIVTSGLLHGETISLTLAPVLLIAMCALLRLGGGRASMDARLRAGGDHPRAA